MAHPQEDTFRHDSESFDVVIVGAGVSGINCAYRLLTELPNVKFTILEGRGEIGGTWDLFKYPGIRTDSDLADYSFSWRPWPFQNPLGEGAALKEYLKGCVSQYEIDGHIRFHHKVLSADWSQDEKQWRVTASHDDLLLDIKAQFLVLGTGYYDYDAPRKTLIPGLDTFNGKTIHPQFWPTDYQYQHKRIAIIGSGATAVSLFPRLAEEAAQVTLVQRSPTYMISMENVPPSLSTLLGFWPLLAEFAKRWNVAWHLVANFLMLLFYKYCPTQAKRMLKHFTVPQLPKGVDYDTHFQPRYNPWEQRLCFIPDNDFFKTLHRPNASIITGHIDRVTENSIRMKDGTTLDVDVIVTATGLRMRLGGGIALSVDGKKVNWEEKLIWNGAMLEGVPNMVFMMGYPDETWTIGADATAYILIRLLRLVKSKGAKSVVPQIPEKGVSGTERMWRLTSTYSKEAESRLPRYGREGPWRPRVYALFDFTHARWGNITKDLRLLA